MLRLLPCQRWVCGWKHGQQTWWPEVHPREQGGRSRDSVDPSNLSSDIHIHAEAHWCIHMVQKYCCHQLTFPEGIFLVSFKVHFRFWVLWQSITTNFSSSQHHLISKQVRIIGSRNFPGIWCLLTLFNFMKPPCLSETPCN